MAQNLYDYNKTMALRVKAIKLLREVFKNQSQQCCNSPIGFALFVIDCRGVMCSGNISKDVTIEALENWLASERMGKNVDVSRVINQDAN